MFSAMTHAEITAAVQHIDQALAILHHGREATKGKERNVESLLREARAELQAMMQPAVPAAPVRKKLLPLFL